MNHERILRAYLARLTLADVRALAAAIESTCQEQMNGTASSQLAAGMAFDAAVNTAIGRMLTCDKQTIASIVRGVI